MAYLKSCDDKGKPFERVGPLLRRILNVFGPPEASVGFLEALAKENWAGLYFAQTPKFLSEVETKLKGPVLKVTG